MNYFSKSGFIGLAILASLTIIGSVQAKSNQQYNNKGGDVEYNATPNSPTLPLVQYPPPQNYPTSVQIGTPSYYYYYPPMYGPGGYGGGYGAGGYGAPSGAGVSFYNNGGPTQRTFYYNTPIPGQVPLGGAGGGGWGGGGFGGYGGYNGGLFVP